MFVFIIIRRATKSTLFPYTTLFRSGQSSHGFKVNFCKFTNETRNAIEEASGESKQAWLCVVDRKSTRLNSSHTVISYAVFCLKKKKKYTMCSHDSDLDSEFHCLSQ